MQKIAALVLYLLISFSSFAGYFYGGLSYSFNGVVSEYDAYNGSNKWAPGLTGGVKFDKLGFELYAKKFTLVNDDYKAGAIDYNIEIDTLMYGLGMRLTLTEGVEFILGINSQSVSARSEPQVSFALLDKSYLSYYLGGGFNRVLYDRYRGHLDMVFYQGDVKYGVLSVIISLVYEFSTF